MTVRIHPSYDAPTSTLIYSGEGDDSFDYVYEITNCEFSADAYTALLGGNGVDWPGVEGVINGCVLRTVQMAPDGPMAWRATCSYSAAKLQTREQEKLTSIGQYRISFSAKGMALKQYTAKTTTAYAAAGDTAPDFKGGINVNMEGEVEGVEAIVPALTINVTQRYAGADLTPAYMLGCANLIGKYNSNEVMGFPAGTLQLTASDGALSFDIPNPNQSGASPADFPAADRELSHEFLYSPNLTGITIGTITGINKKGHQYMWTLWKDTLDSGKVFRTPRAVYVHDLFGIEPANFGPLGLTV